MSRCTKAGSYWTSTTVASLPVFSATYTGLVNGVPAFYMSRLAVRDGRGRVKLIKANHH